MNLMASFRRKPESSVLYIPRSGQNEPLTASFEERPNRNVIALRAIRSIDWIPACAGMTGGTQ